MTCFEVYVRMPWLEMHRVSTAWSVFYTSRKKKSPPS